jgi:hypothetical protein
MESQILFDIKFHLEISKPDAKIERDFKLFYFFS